MNKLTIAIDGPSGAVTPGERRVNRARRLDVMYENGVVFRHPIPRATRPAGPGLYAAVLQTVTLSIRTEAPASSANTRAAGLFAEALGSPSPPPTHANAAR